MTPHPAPRTPPHLFLALLSATLLVLSFPSFNQPWCAWVALVPWLVLLRRCAPRAAFGWSFLIGTVFFLVSLWWLTYVTVFGWIGLCVILAAYFAIFGWLVALLGSARQDAPAGFGHVTSGCSLLLVPAIWVSTEFLRARLFSGFGWNMLAYSQTPWREPIQVADVTGAWGVSFLIVLVNSALAGLLHPDSPKSVAVRNLLMAGGLAAAAIAYGTWRIPQAVGESTIRVAVVQGSIPQDQKWDAAYQAKIFARYTALTKTAAATHPDLIVWPETSVPGYFGVDEDVTQWVLGLARTVQHPLLVGAPVPSVEGSLLALKNEAALVDQRGDILGRYDKLHLVPFGEYVPFERWLPWLRTVTPPSIGTFTPGHEYTVFDLKMGHGTRDAGQAGQEDRVSPVPRPPSLKFSVLICFEDVFPELARRFVQRGAQMLFVITNDAWFGPTGEALQHTQASTFRAIELRVPIARAANTGWSGCIDASGQWLGSVHDVTGNALFVDGTHTCQLSTGIGPTPYLHWGDWFAGLCLVVTCIWLGLHYLLREHAHPPL